MSPRMRWLMGFLVVVLAIAGLAYHVASARAGEASTPQLLDLAWRHADGRAYAIDSNGAIYSSGGFCGPFDLCGHLPPGITPVCFLDGDVGGSLDIGCADGSIYTLTGSCPSVGLSFCTNVFGSTVSTAPKSWGQMKIKLR